MPLCRPFMLGWWEPIMKTLVLLSQAKNSRTHSVEFSWGSSAKLSSRCLQPQPTQLLTCLLSSPSLIHSSKFPLCFLGVTFLKKPHKHVLRSGSVLGESLRPRKTFKWWWTCAPGSVYYYLPSKRSSGVLVTIQRPGYCWGFLCQVLSSSVSAVQAVCRRPWAHMSKEETEKACQFCPLCPGASVSSAPFLRH